MEACPLCNNDTAAITNQGCCGNCGYARSVPVDPEHIKDMTIAFHQSAVADIIRYFKALGPQAPELQALLDRAEAVALHGAQAGPPPVKNS